MRGLRGGLTLLEVLAAMVLASVVIVLSTRLFLGAKAQGWLRGRESEMLGQALLLRQIMADSLPIHPPPCFGKVEHPPRFPLWFAHASLPKRLNDLDSLIITCQLVSMEGAEEGESLTTKAQYLYHWKAVFRSGKMRREVTGSRIP